MHINIQELISSPIPINLTQAMDDLKMCVVNIAHRQLVGALYFCKRHYQICILIGTLRVYLEASN